MKFKELIEQANVIQGTSSKWYGEEAKKIRTEIAKAKTDLNLSAEGRINKSEKIRNYCAKELMNNAKKMKSEYISLLNEAKSEAEKTIKAGIKKADDEKIEAFQRDLKRVKAELMLSNNFDKSKAILDDLIGKIDDGYIGNLLADEFINLIPQALSTSSEPVKAKLVLSRMFEQVSNDFIPEDIKEAKNAIQLVDASLENPKIFTLGAVENADDLFGSGLGSRFLNKPEEFLELIASVEEDLEVTPERVKIGSMPKLDEESNGTSYRTRIIPESKFD